MSSKNNVNPDHYKVAGAAPVGETPEGQVDENEKEKA